MIMKDFWFAIPVAVMLIIAATAHNDNGWSGVLAYIGGALVVPAGVLAIMGIVYAIAPGKR
jgi:hypothetical protein